VWRNKDPALDARLKVRNLALLLPLSTASVNLSSRRSLHASPPPQALTTKGDLGVCPVHCRVTGTAGEPLSLALSTAPFAPDGAATGPVAHGQTESVLVAAASRPLGPAEVAAAVGTLGDTPFRLTDGDAADNDGGSMSRVRARTTSSSADPFVDHPLSAPSLTLLSLSLSLSLSHSAPSLCLCV